MNNFNERTALNYRLRQDALTTQSRARMARQRQEYRHHRTALRNAFHAAVIDITLISTILTVAVTLLACAVC